MRKLMSEMTVRSEDERQNENEARGGGAKMKEAKGRGRARAREEGRQGDKTQGMGKLMTARKGGKKNR